MAVVGVKKWAKASLEKRAKANHPLRKHVKSVEHRLANEIPQTIFFDLISEVGPILKRCADEYKIQLGEKHIFTKECNSHLQALLLKGRNMGLDIPGMVDKSKNSLLETNHGTSPDSTFEPPQSCCIPMPFFSRSARVVPEMVEYEKRQLTGGNKSRKTIGREDDEDDELDSPMTPNAHLVIDIP